MKKSTAIIASCLLLVFGTTIPAMAKSNESSISSRTVAKARQTISLAKTSWQSETTKYHALVKQMDELPKQTQNVTNAMRSGKKIISSQSSRVNASIRLVETDIRLLMKNSTAKKVQKLQHDTVQLNQSIHWVDVKFQEWAKQVHSLIISETTTSPSPPSTSGNASGNSSGSTGVQPPPPPPPPSTP